jgi:hypothetical protein
MTSLQALERRDTHQAVAGLRPDSAGAAAVLDAIPRP